MSWDHEHVERLLALHALGGLDDEDADLAERAILEHVPGCDDCRHAMDAYRMVAGDLGLGAPAVSPPDALRIRLRRSFRRRAGRAWTRPAWSGAAAVVAVAAALSVWNVMLTERLNETETRHGLLVDAVSTLGHPERAVLPLSGQGEERVALLYVRGEQRLYVIATRLQKPHHAYHVWMMEAGRPWHAGVLESDKGVAMMTVATDPERWDAVMITDEPQDARPHPQVSPLVSATVLPE